MPDYIPQTWADVPATTTPVSAARLAYIEAGVDGAQQTADDAANTANTHTHTSTVATLAELHVGGSFNVYWNGTAWTYGGTVITARPTARTNVHMFAFGNTTTSPAFMIAQDIWFKEVVA